MSIKPITLTENNEEKDNIVAFDLITGGKSGDDGDWLSDMELGTMFLIEEKPPMNAAAYQPDFNLGRFIIAGKTDKSVILAGPNAPGPIHVNPKRFCRKFNCFETLGIIEDTSTPKVSDDT